MKKIIFCLLMALCTLLAKAQSKYLNSFGIKAGPNFYSLKGEDYNEGGYKTKTGIHAGLFYQKHLAGLICAQTELLYSSEGIKFKDEDLKADVQLNYLNLPIMFQLVTPSGFYAETGPQLGFLLNAKATYEEIGGDKYEEKLTEDLKKTVFSWGMGVGYFVGRVGVGARYNLGLSKILKEPNQSNDKSSGFQISLIAKIKN